MNGRLFLLIGPTGVGKTSLISKVIDYPFLVNSSINYKFFFRKNKLPIKFIPSYTTRSMRKDESNGNPYFFISRDEFERKIYSGELIEWKFVHGSNYYGIGRKEITDALNKGENLITDIEVLGAMEVIECFPSSSVCIFVDVPSRNELINRMKKRDANVSNNEIEARLRRIEFEYSYRHHFKYLIINDDLDEAVKNLAIIMSYEMSLADKFMRPESSIIHNSISLFIKNLKDEILLYQRKSPFSSTKWSVPNIHILSNESPQDAIYRELYNICSTLPYDYKEQIYSLKPVSNRRYTLDTHNHYELEFRIQLDLPDIYSENYSFKWASNSHGLL